MILTGRYVAKINHNESAASHLLLGAIQNGPTIDIEPSKWQRTWEVVRVRDRVSRTWRVRSRIDLKCVPRLTIMVTLTLYPRVKLGDHPLR